MTIEAGLGAWIIVFLSTVARERRQKDMFRIVLSTEPARHLTAIQPRQTDIQEDDIGPVGPYSSECGQTVRCAIDIVAIQSEQQLSRRE